MRGFCYVKRGRARKRFEVVQDRPLEGVMGFDLRASESDDILGLRPFRLEIGVIPEVGPGTAPAFVHHPRNGERGGARYPHMAVNEDITLFLNPFIHLVEEDRNQRWVK